MEFVICDGLVIDETELAERKFFELTGSEIKWEKMSQFVNEAKEKTVFYFDKELKRQTTFNNETLYVWIDTGYVYGDETVFMSLMNYYGYCNGHYVGTGKFLCERLCNRDVYKSKRYRTNFQDFMKKYHQIKRNDRLEQEVISSHLDREAATSIGGKIDFPMEERGQEKLKTTDNSADEMKDFSAVTEEIYSNLLFQGWKTIDGLDTYIKVLGKRAHQLIENHSKQFFIMNKLGSIILNTGLMDIYGNDILVIYRKHLKMDTYEAYKLITGKRDYLDEGFSMEQINIQIRPLSFFDEDEKTFNPGFNDFDINMKSLNHIVEERKDRFPENLRDASTEYITQLIICDLQQGLKIQERDPSYARPIYTDGRITWLLPLRLGQKITEEPELVLAIRKSGDFYELKTILMYDDWVKDKITALALYRKIW